MPDAIYTGNIVVTGPRLTVGLDFLFDRFFHEVYAPLPAEQKFGPLTANRHGVNVFYDGPPPLKPGLIQTAIDRISAAIDEIGDKIDSLSDDAVIRISKTETISGAEMKARFNALREVRVTEKIYDPGYGGSNYGYGFEISSQTAAGWNSFGEGGTRLLILHEISHNSATGDAIRKQNWMGHLADGGTKETYNKYSPWFVRQEQMTNTLARNLANELGIDIDPVGNYGPYPPYGYYEGSDLK